LQGGGVLRALRRGVRIYDLYNKSYYTKRQVLPLRRGGSLLKIIRRGQIFIKLIKEKKK
jgi:hypothetical protein